MSDPLGQWWLPESRSDVACILLGDANDWHTWPLVTWFSLVAFGFVPAHGYRRVGSSTLLAGGCALLGQALMLAAALSDRLLPVLDGENMVDPIATQPPTIMVLGVVGTALRERWQAAS